MIHNVEKPEVKCSALTGQACFKVSLHPNKIGKAMGQSAGREQVRD